MVKGVIYCWLVLLRSPGPNELSLIYDVNTLTYFRNLLVLVTKTE